MNLIELILTGVTSIFVLGTPMYLYFRGRMSRSRIKKTTYSKRRVIKITLINILVHFIALLLLFGLYFAVIANTRTFNIEYIILSLLFFILITLIFYGGGIYVTSIVLEAYTIPELTKSEFFKTQLIAIKIFHHPISHILVFSGGLFAMLILALLDLTVGNLTPTNIPLLIFAGFLGGVFYAYAQIHNGTAIFQIPAGLICLALLFLGIHFQKSSIYQTTLGIYFLTALIMFDLSLLIYILSLKRRNKKIIKPLAEIHPITPIST